jgi:RNA polymerase sigma-B factor
MATDRTRVRSQPTRGRRSRTDRRAYEHARGGDADRRERLIEQYLPLAERVARRYAHTSEPLEDLVQVARIGLMKAAERWDPARGTSFTSFAVPTMTGELRRYFRDSTWTIRPPRDLQELHLAVGHAREELWQELGREPSAGDVATHLGRTVEDILDAIQAGDAYSPKSLDAPLHDDEEGDIGQDLLVDRRANLSGSEDGMALEQLSAVLSEREREVVRLRFVEDLLQREIAERVGCSQMQVSRILTQALRRLQAAAAGSADDPS